MSGREGGRAGSGPGGGLGFVAALLMGPLVLFILPAGWVLAVVVVAGAFVLLNRDNRFQRDLGAGMLAGFAIFMLVFGICTATFAAID